MQNKYRSEDRDCDRIHSDHLHVSFYDGFDSRTRVLLDDSLIYDGIARTDHSTGLANIHFDAGDTATVGGKVLRVEIDGACMSVRLENGWPALDVHRANGWWVNYRDWVLTLE